MQKWEYLVVKQIKEAEFNNLGAKGWELVAVAVSLSGIETYYFKRPI